MIRKTNFLLSIALICAGASTAQAACPSVPTVSRFSFNAAGDEVTDSKTGLVWARCSVGQVWSGSACTGSASTHTHEQALQLAQAATGWRLPNVKELSSIADKGCQSPAIDSTAFPNTLGFLYWSSTPYVGETSSVWFVNFYGGNVYQGPRVYGFGPGVLRLVRASP